MTWWFFANRKDATKAVWLETDRWFDARAEAWKLLGEDISAIDPRTGPSKPPKNSYADKKVFRVFWVGSAANFNNLHRVIEPVLEHTLFCTGCGKQIHIHELEKISGMNMHVVELLHDGVASSAIACGPLVMPQKKKKKKK